MEQNHLPSNSNSNSNNPFLKNAERTLFTFNTHQITEFCFHYISQQRRRQDAPNWEFSKSDGLLVDQCFQKYMQAFKITQRVVEQNLSEMARGLA